MKTQWGKCLINCNSSTITIKMNTIILGFHFGAKKKVSNGQHSNSQGVLLHRCGAQPLGALWSRSLTSWCPQGDNSPTSLLPSPCQVLCKCSLPHASCTHHRVLCPEAPFLFDCSPPQWDAFSPTPQRALKVLELHH